MTPINRQATRQPVVPGSSIKTSASRGSSSSPRVEGTKPKSYGKLIPSGKTFLSLKIPSSSSYAILVAPAAGCLDDDVKDPSALIVRVFGLELRRDHQSFGQTFHD